MHQAYNVLLIMRSNEVEVLDEVWSCRCPLSLDQFCIASGRPEVKMDLSPTRCAIV